MKNFLLGCNFWDSKSGTDMWLNFDEASLTADLDALAASGVSSIRCFPNWRDFQPVTALRSWRGNLSEYRLTGDRLPENEYYIDEEMIKRFRIFARLCEERGISLVVSVLTGWMSGRLFYPPCLEGKNLICDHEALMFEEKFVRGFVKMTKDIKNIVMWDLGNECNCLGPSTSRATSYVWTANVRNAILASDTSRPISSGMHGLDFSPMSTWAIADQGALTDYLTPHPYPSPTIGGDVDPADRMRTTMLPTAQCAYYEGVSHKPVILQEQGTFSDMLIDRLGASDFMRVNICSAIANDVKGYFWWCGMEHLHLTKPPYTWSMIERELGLLQADRTPKPVGEVMKQMSEVIASLPELPRKEENAVIILSAEQNQWAIGATSYILAKRAGLSPVIRSFTDIDNIPHVPIYILPSIVGWAPLHKEIIDVLTDRVENEGATLLLSTESGFITEFERIVGMRSHGMCKGGVGSMTFGGTELPIEYGKHFDLQSIGAEVIASDRDGTPVFSRNKFGKGYVYFLAFPPEAMLWRTVGAYGEGKADYSLLYAEAAREVIASQPTAAKNPETPLTLHKTEDGYIIIAVNYTSTTQNARLKIKEGYSLLPIYGSFDSIEKCNMAVGRLTKN